MNIWVAWGLFCLGGAPVSSSDSIDDPAVDANRAATSEIQRALHAEAEGREVDRRQHLESALMAVPDHRLARGLLGLVSTDGTWVPVREAIDRARRDDRVGRRASVYLEKRRDMPNSPDAHLVLARWCAREGLRAEAQAHFTAVTRLDPDNEEAWRTLGRRWHEGRWMTGEEIAAEAEEAAKQASADDFWLPRLAALKADLRLGRLGPETQKILASIVDPRCVPSIETVFGRDKSFEQAWRVRLLSRIDSVESSRSLAGLLATTRDDAVRAAAARVLSRRDPRVYLGFLINQMKEPTRYYTQPGFDGENGYLLVDTPEAMIVREYDPATVRRITISPTSGSRSAASLAFESPAFRRMAGDVRSLDFQNRQVILDNARIARSLRELTGQPFQYDREQWSSWWSDQLGYRHQPIDQRPKPVTYESIAYPVGAAPNQSRTGLGTAPTPRRSCFASGTLVVSRTGFAPIEDLEIGDRVLSQDTKTGALSFQPILSIEHDPPDATLRIEFDDQFLICNDVHRFWKAGGGWVIARDIRPGDALRGVGRVARVRAIRWNRIEPVHNIEVARNQSFFVGLAGLLVHDSTLAAPTGAVFDVQTAPAGRAVPAVPEVAADAGRRLAPARGNVGETNRFDTFNHDDHARLTPL